MKFIHEYRPDEIEIWSIPDNLYPPVERVLMNPALGHLTRTKKMSVKGAVELVDAALPGSEKKIKSRKVPKETEVLGDEPNYIFIEEVTK